MRGGNIVAVGILGGACPLADVASMAWCGSKPRNKCLSICERLNVTVCTCEVLSYPNSPTTSGLMAPYTVFASVTWGGGRVALEVLGTVWPQHELATMTSGGSSSEFASCVGIQLCYPVLVRVCRLVVGVGSIAGDHLS